ncbi:unnamed protein product [Vitrella brassicaformis CCMP3155]|uniref:EF-hand domain-containing protein n=1 Tax=Vitrella brassicaformis (strain CCMP3155) TaxID=1169540 RepID=A0A0G4EGC0_VITBC|nr:unnamed protein product [Vitrella brassicaformis CCMP3155]|eukprot:CEL94444.1 unnamed protein product [Vitrella brassicaformis CCMP3155]
MPFNSASAVLGLSSDELKDRITKIFPLIDTDGDGVLSRDEIVEWLRRINEKVTQRQTRLEYDAIDKDSDGRVTLAEVRESYYGENQHEDDEAMADVKKRFEVADKDQDYVLSLVEFEALMHPSKDEDLMKLELDEILNAQDKDYDRKISWEEFRSDQDEDVKVLEDEFRQYDRDGDQYIDEDDIRALLDDQGPETVEKDADELIADTFGPEASSISLTSLLEKLDAVVQSRLTDYGELLRFPAEYDLTVSFDEPIIQHDEL